MKKLWNLDTPKVFPPLLPKFVMGLHFQLVYFKHRKLEAPPLMLVMTV